MILRHALLQHAVIGGVRDADSALCDYTHPAAPGAILTRVGSKSKPVTCPDCLRALALRAEEH